MKLPAPPLLLITDRRQARLSLPEIAGAAFEAGCRWISVRERDLDETALAALLLEIRARAKPYSASVSLHGRPETAKQAGAGVHLASGHDPHHARRILGGDKLVGISIHSAAEAARLDPAAVDYAIAGAVFETASKPGYKPLGVEGLRGIVDASPVPVLAIGGIGARNCGGVIRAGAAGIAVMGGIMRAADPGGEVRALIAALRAAG